MSRINLLDSSVYNLISAGEVVEGPFSVVKELVENSIDAGARNITVEISDGGKTRIRVSDDGEGMDADDLEKAFLPHATSKIGKKSDLDSIATLGFRGEALASMAAVAMIDAVSKTRAAETASRVEIRDGRVVSSGAAAGTDGTSVSVENLFYATPARLKFLKSPKSEERKVTALVQDLALANPDISFAYSADGKELCRTHGDGLENAVYNVLGREIASNMVPIENTYGNFRLHGFISKPSYARGNRSRQTIILNGRVISNDTIRAAVEKAYERFLTRWNYPLFVLNLNVSRRLFDVNVHPGKTDVRFADGRVIFSFVWHSVSGALSEMDAGGLAGSPSEGAVIRETDPDTGRTERLTPVRSSGAFRAMPSGDTQAFFRMVQSRAAAETGKIARNAMEAGFGRSARLPGGEDAGRMETARQESMADCAGEDFGFEGKIVGQVFSTYILVEKGDRLYVIDQHAAHERILYDRLLRQKTVYSQRLLLPYIYECAPSEYELIAGILPELRKTGFEAEEISGTSIKVDAVPEILAGMNLETFFGNLAGELRGTARAGDAVREKLMRTACRSAVKGGDSFTPEQIEYLLKIFAAAGEKPLRCPHGRPAVIAVSKAEFERRFGRKS